MAKKRNNPQQLAIWDGKSYFATLNDRRIAVSPYCKAAHQEHLEAHRNDPDPANRTCTLDCIMALYNLQGRTHRQMMKYRIQQMDEHALALGYVLLRDFEGGGGTGLGHRRMVGHHFFDHTSEEDARLFREQYRWFDSRDERSQRRQEKRVEITGIDPDTDPVEVEVA
jgi:hypothetical protein